jgi:Viral coat protein P2 N-terminal domain
MDQLKLNAFPSVPATGTASLTTDQLRGYSVHGIVLERGGTTFTNAQISSVRARLNGKDIVNLLSGSQLAAMNDYEGYADVTNYTFLFFGDPAARTIRGQHLGDVDCSVYDYPLTIEVDINGATAPTLQAYALVGVPKQQMGIGYSATEAAILRALPRTVIQPSGAVARNAYGISIGSSPGARIRRVWFFNANLTSVDLMKQSLIKWQDASSALNSAIAQQFVRTPQAGLYVLDRILDGNQGESETTVSPNGKQWNIQVSLTTSAADTITAFADIFTTLPGL